MRKQGFFLVFIMCLTLGLQFSYQVFREHYSEEKVLVSQIQGLERDKHRMALQQSLLQNQIEDLQINAMQVLGEKKVLAWNEKQWFSALRGPASAGELRPGSGALLMQAKDFFKKRDFARASEKLQNLIHDFPSSKDIVEAHFLLAESLFLSAQFEPSLEVIEQMIARYPESELTGFIMLRMGQIFERRNRTDEAEEVYETVIREFSKQREIRTQAEKLKRNVKKS